MRKLDKNMTTLFMRLRVHHKRSILAVIFFSLWMLMLSGCKPAPSVWQGYNEGRYTYISVNYPGILNQLYVDRGTMVKAGQPLFVLEQQPESDELKQAESDLASAQDTKVKDVADLALAQLTYDRDKSLVPKGAIQQSILDAATDDLTAKKSALAQAEVDLINKQSKLTQAQWTLKQKSVVATKDGVIFDTYFRTGELVQTGQSVISLLAPNDIRAIFYVPETDLGKIHFGQKVVMNCDGCGEAIKGNVVFVSPQAEYTPPVIYSDESRSKLVFRIEALPEQQYAWKLHPGQPVTVSPAS